MSSLGAQPVSSGEFAVYSDACVMGAWIMEFRGGESLTWRKREGPAMGAWIGWLGCEPATRPTIAGQPYLGHQGTQTAEYLSVIHALNAVLAFVRLSGRTPEQVVLHVDNETLEKTLWRDWGTKVLTPHRQLAEKIGHELRDLGVGLAVKLVSVRNVHHKAAHRMSKWAWNQLFYKEQWRPARLPPAEWREREESPDDGHQRRHHLL